jgi:hypothetical protein
MTKKHFVAMAIQFAKVQSSICTNDRDVDVKASQLVGVQLAIDAFCEVAKQANANFDKEYFTTFIHEIFWGKRDADGKKVTKGKLEDFLTHSELSEALIAQRKAKA